MHTDKFPYRQIIGEGVVEIVPEAKFMILKVHSVESGFFSSEKRKKKKVKRTLI